MLKNSTKESLFQNTQELMIIIGPDYLCTEEEVCIVANFLEVKTRTYTDRAQ